MALASNPRQHEPLFDMHPQTGTSIEVFYADRTLETFGRCGAGWFWWLRQRGCAPVGTPTGPFATSYAAYRHAVTMPAPLASVTTTRARLSWTRPPIAYGKNAERMQ
jgi:hypothetical protein